ncbi:MAG: O-acetyl-ADP-ribose deacetylase [Candidatus Kerfeldbacteria bacterium]|nr:O-acetyl-ADP-ribose deacetylase [Candidatus Kerfeldbacteria bacterium]
MTKIIVALGDITHQNTEAIVNSANPSLLGGGGVDGAIHAAAGPELLEECRKLGGCKTGEAKITNGHKLPADYIIHTVGPVYGMTSGHDGELLTACYRSCLDLAKDHLIRSIAFPSISTGAYGYPIAKAAPIAIEAVLRWVKDHPDAFSEIRFLLHSTRDYDVYAKLLGET